MNKNKSTLYYKDYKVEIFYKTHLKHTYLSIKNSKEIHIKTPLNSQKYIQKLLEEKQIWIEKSMSKLQHQQNFHIKLQEEAFLFGKCYPIKDPLLQHLSIQLHKLPQESSKEKILSIYNAFYKNIAQEYITQRVLYFASLMQLEYQTIKFRKMKRRWGSCSTKKVLTFNTELIKIDKKLIDYVVVHELAHLVHMNHSQAFHTLVASYLDDATTLKKELRNIHIS